MKFEEGKFEFRRFCVCVQKYASYRRYRRNICSSIARKALLLCFVLIALIMFHTQKRVSDERRTNNKTFISFCFFLLFVVRPHCPLKICLQSVNFCLSLSTKASFLPFYSFVLSIASFHSIRFAITFPNFSVALFRLLPNRSLLVLDNLCVLATDS